MNTLLVKNKEKEITLCWNIKYEHSVIMAFLIAVINTFLTKTLLIRKANWTPLFIACKTLYYWCQLVARKMGQDE